MIDLKDLEKFEQICITSSVIHTVLSVNVTKKNNHVYSRLNNLMDKPSKYYNELWFIITCMARAKANNKLGNAISFNKVDYTKAGKMFDIVPSRVKLKRVIDQLIQENIIDVYKGYYNTHVGSKQTCIIFKDLDRLLVDVTDDDKDTFDLIEIKDSVTGELIETDDVETLRILSDGVQDLNTVLNGTDIQVNGVKVKPQYKRVYTDDFNGQGRYYTNDEFLSIPKTDREGFTFDSEVCVGYDITATHAAILYESEGRVMLSDPYQLEGIDRGFCKFLFMCMLYNDNRRDCINAVRDKIRKDKRKKKGFHNINYNYKEISEIVDKLINKNKSISKYFLSDKLLWAKLQNIDSSIATIVIKHFIKEGHPILVWHDSWIFTESFESEIVGVVGNAWKEVLGSNINCKISKEF